MTHQDPLTTVCIGGIDDVVLEDHVDSLHDVRGCAVHASRPGRPEVAAAGAAGPPAARCSR